MKKSLTALVLVASLVASSTANAALTAMLTLKGKGGEIKGSVIQKGREGKIAVIAAEHEVKALTTGRRQHGVYTITKEVDKASPLLYRAMAVNDVLSFELNYWQPNTLGSAGGGGQERLYYTVKLTNARITEIKHKMPNNKNPELVRYAEFEEVSFSYDTIEWVFTDGNIAASDSGR